MNNDPNPIDAILYGRVSTDKQEMSRQDFMTAEYCARLNLNPVHAINDDAVSGLKSFAERPGGREVMRIIDQYRAAGKPFAFVTAEQDRIGRDAVDQIQTLRRVWQAGGTPHLVAEGGGAIRTPENELFRGMRACASQYERDKIVQRINDKLREKRSKNELCGTEPYGWRAVETGQITPKGVPIRKLEPNPPEQQWILHMHRLRQAGHGYHTIAKDLNSRGVPTKRPKGTVMNLSNGPGVSGNERFVSGQWQAGNVAKVLNNQTTVAWLATQSNQAAA